MKKFYFTLTVEHAAYHWPHRPSSCGVVEITVPDRELARTVMIANFGEKWAFQYDDLESVHPLDRKILHRIGAAAVAG